MVEFREMLIYGVLIGLFIVSLAGVGLQMALDNGVTNSFFLESSQYEAISSTSNTTETQLTSAQESAEAQEEVQGVTNPTVSGGDLLLDSTPPTAQALKSGSRANFVSAFNMIATVLSSNPAILAAFTTILLISFVTLIWSFIKSGR